VLAHGAVAIQAAVFSDDGLGVARADDERLPAARAGLRGVFDYIKRRCEHRILQCIGGAFRSAYCRPEPIAL
jgi:hypothetical protein